MLEKANISIVIPFLNEAENIPELIKELEALQGTHSDIKFELVFVDDGSTDNSIVALNNSLAFGGNNASLVIGRRI